MKRLFKHLWQEDNGNNLAEYVLLAGVLSLGAIVAMGDLGTVLIRLLGAGTPMSVGISRT